jgi:hypothetical protein
MFKYCSKTSQHAKLPTAFNVSSQSSHPYFKLFSPFSTEFSISMPQSPSTRVDSVERLWQGSKCRDIGTPNWYVLTGRIDWKKGTIPEYGIWLGDSISTVDKGKGRRIVYIPAYIEFCNQVLLHHPEIYDSVKIMAQSLEIFYLYDFDYSIDYDTSAPLSHAKILVDYFKLLFN